MRVIRAEHLGMCFGVRDAVDLARHALREHTVLAPSDGTVLRVQTNPGEVLGPQSRHPALLFAPEKEGKQWRLMIGSGPEGDLDNWTPLANASRDTRLEALDLLPKLVEDMLQRAEKEVTEVKDKTFREDLSGAYLSMAQGVTEPGKLGRAGMIAEEF